MPGCILHVVVSDRVRQTRARIFSSCKVPCAEQLKVEITRMCLVAFDRLGHCNDTARQHLGGIATCPSHSFLHQINNHLLKACVVM